MADGPPAGRAGRRRTVRTVSAAMIDLVPDGAVVPA
jgi:hypothetical protein